MKESGINYFLSQSNIGFDDFKVFYTFEPSGDLNYIFSSLSGSSLFSGQIIGDTGNFWSILNSGNFSGNKIELTNITGLESQYFTHVFSLEIKETGKQILFSNLTGGSGLEIGITDSSLLYVKANQDFEYFQCFDKTIADKNIFAVSCIPNSLVLQKYNVNKKVFDLVNRIEFNEKITNNNKFTLGESFNGYMDYYLYFNNILDTSNLNQIISGLFYTPTGFTYNITTFCDTGITGYINVEFFNTGITGYLSSGTGNYGLGEFTGAYSSGFALVPLTGFLETGIYASGLTGIVCYDLTGSATGVLYSQNSGYAESFNYSKVINQNYIDSSDTLNVFYDLNIFNDKYNYAGDIFGEGFLNQGYLKNNIVIYSNGLLQSKYKTLDSGLSIFVSGTDNFDEIIFDNVSGEYVYYTGGLFGFNNYSGNQIFLNGLLLNSGIDYNVIDSDLFLSENMSGISGELIINPLILSNLTGNSGFLNVFSPQDNVLVYKNGVRQKLNMDVFQVGTKTMLNSNTFNDNIIGEIYFKNGTFWE